MSEAKPKAKESKKITVKVLETRGESSLVEWNERGIVHRGYIPNDLIHDDKAMVDVLANALPYGFDPMSIDLRKLTERLHLRDVWTLVDLQQKRNCVIRSLLEAMEVK
jgi:hypothetical protein